MKISFIQPSRNNLKYLKWSYDAIRKNQGEHTVQICVADDASTDRTWEWCQERMKNDEHFSAILNDTGKRQGHTILYDRLVNEVAEYDVCMIYHADMYLCPGALDAIEKHMYHERILTSNPPQTKLYPNEKTIVSLTRIEPPLHPDGPEKVLLDCGVEPEVFNEQLVLDYVKNTNPVKDTTEGIFAPWAFWKSDFQEIGGHDPLYAPQSKEDSDIFNRFQLNGIKFIQTWEGFVYHMTCRGSRRNTADKATSIYQDSPEWLEQNQRSTRNFIRKWGHFVAHDALMKPIVPPKYDIGFNIINCTPQLLEALEPWCSRINVDLSDSDIDAYIYKEQPNTIIDLSTRINTGKDCEIQVQIDGNKFNQNEFNLMTQLPLIIQDSGSVGEFQIGNLHLKINKMNEYQNKLIFLND
jgi:glycosyltransferase involved in cell wall biosynthesis